MLPLGISSYRQNFTLTGLLGLPLGNNVMAYTHLGWENGRLKVTSTLGDNLRQSFNGLFAALGLNYYFIPHWSLHFEWIMTNFEDTKQAGVH